MKNLLISDYFNDFKLIALTLPLYNIHKVYNLSI